MVCNIKMMTIAGPYKFTVALLVMLICCLFPGLSFPDSDPHGAMVKASDVVPVIEAAKEEPSSKPVVITETPKPGAALEIRSAKPEPQKPETEVSQNRPLLINVDPEDRKAHLAIEESIRMFTQSIRPRFSMWLERSGRYIEIMQDILKERNMPTELVFLPIVESGFNPKAYSKARAAGPWQFIAATAKRYGLAIDWWKDERKDPVKSTIAASKYLRDLYNMFGSWSLALAAYNAGEGRISKALKKSNSEDYWDLLSTKQIRQETKDYVPRYIAATMIANTPEEYGFDNLEYHAPFEYDEVIVYQPVDLEIAAQCAGTDVETIRDLNPELRRWSTPPNVKEYRLRIPSGKADSFVEKLADMPENKLFSYDKYVVKKSDSIKKIAAKTKVPISVILELNSLAGIERLGAGEVIKLPPHGKYFADIDDRMTALKAAREKRSKSRCIAKGKKGKKKYIACSDDEDTKSKNRCIAKGKKGKKKYVACNGDDDSKSGKKYAKGKKDSKRYVYDNDDLKPGKKRDKAGKGAKKRIAAKEKKSNDKQARVKSKKSDGKHASAKNGKSKKTTMKSGKKNGSRA